MKDVVKKLDFYDWLLLFAYLYWFVLTFVALHYQSIELLVLFVQASTMLTIGSIVAGGSKK